MQDKPWRWTADREVTVECQDKTLKVFRLMPADPARVAAFADDLQAADEVSRVFRKAHLSFTSGQASYEGAFERVKHLRHEMGRALGEQMDVAAGIDQFLQPAGISKEFGRYVDLMTEFSLEAVERLLRPAEPETQDSPMELPPIAHDPPPVPSTTAE